MGGAIVDDKVRAMRLNWISLDQGAPGAIRAGDLVSVEAGGLPVYRVMSVENGRAWLRDELDGADCISPLSRFHWKAYVEA
jgi:hypothetical protein